MDVSATSYFQLKMTKLLDGYAIKLKVNDKKEFYKFFFT